MPKLVKKNTKNEVENMQIKMVHYDNPYVYFEISGYGAMTKMQMYKIVFVVIQYGRIIEFYRNTNDKLVLGMRMDDVVKISEMMTKIMNLI